MKNTKRSILLIAMAGLLLTVVVSSTLAYLVDQSASVVNTFTPSYVACEVIEDQFNGETKTNVRVENTGNTEAFIRAAVVATWQNEQGNVLGIPVKNTDYSISYNDTDWTQADDGFWYYKSSVPAEGNDETEKLINSCTASVAAPVDGYTLHVEILAQAIQAEGVTDATGATAYKDVWTKAVEYGN